MLSEQNINITNGNISEGPEPDDSVKAVIEFIKTNFKEFAEINKATKAKNEKGLNQKLCIYLNRKLNSEPFFFQHEFIENVESGISPQVDIGTIAKEENVGTFENQYIDDDSFFSFEAKRLPQEKKEREKEYVTGQQSSTGAMERFKKGIHGSRLKFAAIIGYVQRENFEHWFLKINSWIEELAVDEKQPIWTNDDKLEKKSSNMADLVIELISENPRSIIGNQTDKIKIFHFWVNLLK